MAACDVRDGVGGEEDCFWGGGRGVWGGGGQLLVQWGFVGDDVEAAAATACEGGL
jgi:hypothetical protein